jgi:hypothetical protein
MSVNGEFYSVNFDLFYLKKYDLFPKSRLVEVLKDPSRIFDGFDSIYYVNFKRMKDNKAFVEVVSKINQIEQNFINYSDKFIAELKTSVDKIKCDKTLVTEAPTKTKYINFPECLTIFDKKLDIKSGDDRTTDKEIWESIEIINLDRFEFDKLFIYENIMVKKVIPVTCFSLLWDPSEAETKSSNDEYYKLFGVP